MRSTLFVILSLAVGFMAAVVSTYTGITHQSITIGVAVYLGIIAVYLGGVYIIRARK